MENFAKQAYEAYGDTVGWKTTRGENMASWDNLSKREQSGWMSAAQVVIDQTLQDTEAAQQTTKSFLAPFTTI